MISYGIEFCRQEGDFEEHTQRPCQSAKQAKGQARRLTANSDLIVYAVKYDNRDGTCKAVGHVAYHRGIIDWKDGEPVT
jgi:hypothetical protein